VTIAILLFFSFFQYLTDLTNTFLLNTLIQHSIVVYLTFNRFVLTIEDFHVL